jgi:hypothetical protein
VGDVGPAGRARALYYPCDTSDPYTVTWKAMQWTNSSFKGTWTSATTSLMTRRHGIGALVAGTQIAAEPVVDVWTP